MKQRAGRRNNKGQEGVTEETLSAQQKEFLEREKQESEMLEAVKRRHKVDKAYMIKVPRNDSYTDFAVGFIRYPSRIDVSIAMTMKDTDPLKGKEIVLRNSWLEGDESILNDDELFFSATTIIDTIIGVRQAIVKKN